MHSCHRLAFAPRAMLLLVLGASLCSAQGNKPSRQTLRLYIFTQKANATGFIAPDYEYRSVSVDRLKKALSSYSIVDSASGSDAQIQVVGIGYVASDAITNFSIKHFSLRGFPNSVLALLVNVTSGKHTLCILGTTLRFYDGSVEAHVAEQVNRWMQLNYQKLISTRTPGGASVPD